MPAHDVKITPEVREFAQTQLDTFIVEYQDQLRAEAAESDAADAVFARCVNGTTVAIERLGSGTTALVMAAALERLAGVQ